MEGKGGDRTVQQQAEASAMQQQVQESAMQQQVEALAMQLHSLLRTDGLASVYVTTMARTKLY